jgi:hypothetical protein
LKVLAKGAPYSQYIGHMNKQGPNILECANLGCAEERERFFNALGSLLAINSGEAISYLSHSIRQYDYETDDRHVGYETIPAESQAIMEGITFLANKFPQHAVGLYGSGKNSWVEDIRRPMLEKYSATRADEFFKNHPEMKPAEAFDSIFSVECNSEDFVILAIQNELTSKYPEHELIIRHSSMETHGGRDATWKRFNATDAKGFFVTPTPTSCYDMGYVSALAAEEELNGKNDNFALEGLIAHSNQSEGNMYEGTCLGKRQAAFLNQRNTSMRERINKHPTSFLNGVKAYYKGHSEKTAPRYDKIPELLTEGPSVDLA